VTAWEVALIVVSAIVLWKIGATRWLLVLLLGFLALVLAASADAAQGTQDDDR
jgi:hypothetical protein